MKRKLASITALLALSGVIFAVVHILHFRFVTVRVVLYDAIVDAVLAALIAAIFAGFWTRLRRGLNGVEVGLSLLSGFQCMVLFAVLVPTVIDRSLSMYVLEKLVQRGGAIREDAFDAILKQEYYHEHRVVDIRLTEQLNSGTILIEDGCVRITPRGERIAWLTRWYRTTLLPRQRDIRGQFVDDLTDPFRRAADVTPFACTTPAR
jgi:hypothetical protein